MLKIDSHQHFWKYNSVRDSWISDDMSVLKRDFLPVDLAPVLDQSGLDGCVVVQSDQSEDENRFQLDNAAEFDFIKGVVGWVDLQAEDIEQKLEYYSKYEKLRGFRHILQGEKQRDFMLRPEFKRGIGLLNKYNFTYDILIFPDQLKYTEELVASFPNQPFVIDHLAKPYIREGKIEDWKRDLLGIAKYENVYCKVSGLVTESDWKAWKPEDFTPYLEAAVESFGIERLMFGSDWPVCQLAATYEETFGLTASYFSSFSKDEQESFFGGTAVSFYNLARR